MAEPRGWFFLRSDLMRDHPEFVLKILRQLEFLPMRVEFQYDRDGFKYYGASPWFELCEVGCVVPEYTIIIETKLEGNARVPTVFKVEKYEQ